MARRSYTFLPFRERGYSFDAGVEEENFPHNTPRYIRHLSISVPWTPTQKTLKSRETSSKMQNREIIISPGNILSKSCTWRKGNETASEEVSSFFLYSELLLL